MEEIKDDLLIHLRKSRFRRLEVVSILMTEDGNSRYPNPKDAYSISLNILDGDTTGTAQAGSANTITLDASDSNTEDDLQGKEIVITSGTGKGSIGQVTLLNTTTPSAKVATVSTNWNDNPASGSGYMIADDYKLLEERPSWEWDRLTNPYDKGEPSYWYPKGDPNYGEFYLYPVPDKVYAMRMRYIADLTQLDLSGTTLASIYLQWRSAFVQGILWKALQDAQKEWYKDERGIYFKYLQALDEQHTLGSDQKRPIRYSKFY